MPLRPENSREKRSILDAELRGKLFSAVNRSDGQLGRRLHISFLFAAVPKEHFASRASRIGRLVCEFRELAYSGVQPFKEPFSQLCRHPFGFGLRAQNPISVE